MGPQIIAAVRTDKPVQRAKTRQEHLARARQIVAQRHRQHLFDTLNSINDRYRTRKDRKNQKKHTFEWITESDEVRGAWRIYDIDMKTLERYTDAELEERAAQLVARAGSSTYIAPQSTQNVGAAVKECSLPHEDGPVNDAGTLTTQPATATHNVPATVLHVGVAQGKRIRQQGQRHRRRQVDVGAKQECEYGRSTKDISNLEQQICSLPARRQQCMGSPVQDLHFRGGAMSQLNDLLLFDIENEHPRSSLQGHCPTVQWPRHSEWKMTAAEVLPSSASSSGIKPGHLAGGEPSNIQNPSERSPLHHSDFTTRTLCIQAHLTDQWVHLTCPRSPPATYSTVSSGFSSFG